MSKVWMPTRSTKLQAAWRVDFTVLGLIRLSERRRTRREDESGALDVSGVEASSRMSGSRTGASIETGVKAGLRPGIISNKDKE